MSTIVMKHYGINAGGKEIMPTFKPSGGPQMGPPPSMGPNPNYVGPSDSATSGAFPAKKPAFGGKKAASKSKPVGQQFAAADKRRGQGGAKPPMKKPFGKSRSQM